MTAVTLHSTSFALHSTDGCASHHRKQLVCCTLHRCVRKPSQRASDWLCTAPIGEQAITKS